MSRPTPKALADLLASAVHEPGVISRAYSAFHGYSISNRLLAMAQCVEREVQPGPINTFPGWKALGRHVRKGEKAITLCMPITVRRKQADVEPDADETADIITRFVYKPRWFVVSQTSGDPIPEAVEPSWDRETALSGLDVTEIPFDHTDGNCMGFARDRSIAINPINPLPHKTRFHEIAHVLLGHTSAGMQTDSEVSPRKLEECEAESVALLCCAALELPGVAEARGYIQTWWTGEIPERSAQRILKTADQVLKAGTDQGVRS